MHRALDRFLTNRHEPANEPNALDVRNVHVAAQNVPRFLNETNLNMVRIQLAFHKMTPVNMHDVSISTMHETKPAFVQ